MFEPYLADVQRQLVQVDAILAVVVDATAEVESLVDWLDQFVTKVPTAIPGNFVQNFSWFIGNPEDPDYSG